MYKIKLLVFFIILSVIFPGTSFSAVDESQKSSSNGLSISRQSQELEPLVISKQKQFLLSSLSTDPRQDSAFNYQSSVENLSNLPIDLQARSLRSGMQTDFSLRGSTFQQVLILLNDQRINDPQTGHFNSDIPFTKEDVKRIQVIPGASSSLFGMDAIGGAINFALVSPKERKIAWEFAAGNNRNGYGLFSISDKIKAWGLRFSIEDAQSKGFRYDTDFKKFTTSLGVYLDLPNGGVWENNFGYQEKAFGAYDFYTPGMGFPSREWTKTYLINSGLLFNIDGLLVKPNFLWRRHYDKFQLKETVDSYNSHRNDMFTPSIYFQKQAGLFGKVGLGVEYGQERITSTNLGRHARDHQALFLDDSLTIGQNWELGLSFRFDNFSDFDPVYTGSGSVKFKLTDNAAFNFGISRNMRIPSFTELYYSDSTTIGNPDLSAEKAWNYQLGFEYKQEELLAGLVLFLRQEQQMIDWVRSTPAPTPWQAKNFTQDDVFGVECFFKKDLNKLISLNAHYAYTNKSINNQGYQYKYGPNYAQHLVSTVFNFHLPFGQQEIAFIYKKRPARNGWLLLNAGLNYNLSKNSKIFFNSTNIFNVEYQDISGIPQPGRYLETGFRLEW